MQFVHTMDLAELRNVFISRRSYEAFVDEHAPDVFQELHSYYGNSVEDALTNSQIPLWYLFERAVLVEKLNQNAKAKHALIRVILRMHKKIKVLEDKVDRYVSGLTSCRN